jgi:zinc D-Ala-D-Ala carboxypeptidase
MNDDVLQGHFRLSEFLTSQTATRRGLSNAPTAQALANIREVLAPGMQRVRNSLGVPVFISSGYRSAEVNAAVGGSASSQHVQGLAADFAAPVFNSPRAICRYLIERSGEIRFDQLIFEGTWVHISFVRGAPRLQALTAHFGQGRVTYSPGVA